MANVGGFGLSTYSLMVWCLVQFSRVARVDSADILSRYKIVFPGRIPTVNGSNFIISKVNSVVSCAVSCNSLSEVCKGFVYQSQTCHSGAETCQLVTFTDPSGVSLSVATSSCQRFYAIDQCWKTNSMCQNGGFCNLSTWPQVCTCGASYTGSHCEVVVTSAIPGKHEV